MLKLLKTLQHVSIIIQIIFREFVGSLLKFGVCVWRTPHTHTHTHTHTPNVMLPHHHNCPFTFKKKLNSVTLRRNLRTPWRWWSE